jgi:hypothetical protein
MTRETPHEPRTCISVSACAKQDSLYAFGVRIWRQYCETMHGRMISNMDLHAYVCMLHIYIYIYIYTHTHTQVHGIKPSICAYMHGYIPTYIHQRTQVSCLKQRETPEIWVAAGKGCTFLERFDYVLQELPSKGILFSEEDRAAIQVLFQRCYTRIPASYIDLHAYLLLKLSHTHTYYDGAMRIRCKDSV